MLKYKKKKEKKKKDVSDPMYSNMWWEENDFPSSLNSR